MRNKSVKEITITAMFGAIYGVIFTLIRFFSSGSDSLLYFFIPLPLAFYSYWKPHLHGLSLLFIGGVLAFLLIDPFRAALIVLPNLILGIVSGFLLRNNVNFIKTFIIFLVSLAGSFLSVYAFEVLTGISFLEDVIKSFASILPFSEVVIRNISLVFIPILLVLEAIMKCVLIILVLKILTTSLKFLKVEPFKIKFNLRLNMLYPILFFILSLLLTLLIIFSKGNFNNFVLYSYIVLITALILLSLLIFFNTAIYLRFYLSLKSFFWAKHNFLLSFIFLLIFPIILIIGLLINLFSVKAELFLAKKENLVYNQRVSK